MFCAIYKWFISQAEDSGKPLPAPVNRHIQRCASCRAFVDVHESLMEAGFKDLSCLPDDTQSALVSKIISSLGRNAEPGKERSRKPIFIPVFASSFILVAVAVAIYFITVPRPNSLHLLSSISEVDNTISSFEERLGEIDSPLDAEYADLKQTMKSTTDFFASYLDVKIGSGLE